jgi:limonene-1,2-epoxide hydrolase
VPSDDTATTPEALVRRFCAAWADLDLDALTAYFTDDAVYHNVPIAPVTGRDAIRATIEGFTAGTERIEFRVRNLACSGPTVLTERVDVFVLPDATVELPVMGVFEVRDGRIAAWRDYFDLNQFTNQLPAARD